MARLESPRNLSRDSRPSHYDACLRTPFAVLGIRTSDGKLTGIEYLPPATAALKPRNELAVEVRRQIEQYLKDPGFRFRLPLALEGTEFQRRVWRVLCSIPSGRVRTYQEVARLLKSAPRPVGGACGANPIPLVVPCHRVVASNGIGGFMNARQGRPIVIKQWLLRHEGC